MVRCNKPETGKSMKQNEKRKKKNILEVISIQHAKKLRDK